MIFSHSEPTVIVDGSGIVDGPQALWMVPTGIVDGSVIVDGRTRVGFVRYSRLAKLHARPGFDDTTAPCVLQTQGLHLIQTHPAMLLASVQSAPAEESVRMLV